MSTRNLMASTVAAALLLSLVLPLTAAAGTEKADIGFQPGYPTGPDYDAFTATLPGLGLLLDGDGDGALNDERCDSNGEARLALVGASFQTLVAAGTLCGALLEGAKQACFAALTVAALALQSEAIVIAQCGLQDGLIDGAELEATFENTRHAIASGLERNLLRCDQLVSLHLPQAFGGRAEEVRNLVEVRIQQFEAAGNPPKAAQEARASLAKGDSAFAQASFGRAYDLWCAAYKDLAYAGPDL